MSGPADPLLRAPLFGAMAAAGDLANLLDVQYIPGSTAQEGPIGELIGSALLAHNNHDPVHVETVASRLGMLAKHLREIRDFDEGTFNRLRDRLLNETSADLHGVRQETVVGGALSRAKLSFLHERPGRPDFILATNQDLGFECTSVHFRRETDDPIRKLTLAIDRKRSKAYAAPGVALCIGITEIEYRTNFGGDVRTAARRALEETDYGAAVLFTEFLQTAEHRYHSVYRRVDAERISPELRSVLDRAWPAGDFDVTGPFAIPGQEG